MARPKKEVKPEVVQVPESNLQQSAEPIFTNSALGMTKDPKTNEWLVVEIKYNLDGQTGSYQVLHRDKLKYIINERFQVEIGKRIM